MSNSESDEHGSIQPRLDQDPRPKTRVEWILAAAAAVAVAIAVLMHCNPYYIFSGELDERPLPKGGGPDAIPMVLGEWTGEKFDVGETTKKVLRIRDIIMTDYTRGSDTVLFAVIFSEVGEPLGHEPEKTYAAAHNEIEESEEDSSTTKAGLNITVKRVVAFNKRFDRRQIMLYWYKAGRSHVLSKRRASHAKGRVALMRLRTDVPPGGDQAKAKALSVLKEFAREVFDSTQKELN